MPLLSVILFATVCCNRLNYLLLVTGTPIFLNCHLGISLPVKYSPHTPPFFLSVTWEQREAFLSFENSFDLNKRIWKSFPGKGFIQRITSFSPWWIVEKKNYPGKACMGHHHSNTSSTVQTPGGLREKKMGLPVGWENGCTWASRAETVCPPNSESSSM